MIEFPFSTQFMRTNYPLANAGFLKGGCRKLENNEDQKGLQSESVRFLARPKFGEDQKKRSLLSFSPAFGPKLGEDQNKKRLHSELVRFFVQN